MSRDVFFINNGPFTLMEIAKACDCDIKDESKKGLKIASVSALMDCAENEICSFYDRKARDIASTTKAGACITSEDLAEFVNDKTAVLISANPKVSALKLSNLFYSMHRPKAEISKMASIHPTAKIGKNVYIGDFVSIAENAVIGDDVVIYSNVSIGRNCEIGRRTIISSMVAISYAKMGENCIIHQGAKIGQDGFGFMFDQGIHKKVPQLGSVIIGNDVEIGANTCIDRGALNDTVIGNGAKFDNMVQVAHGVQIGNNCIVVALVGIGGSSVIEDYAVIGPMTAVKDHVRIGKGAQIVAQSGILRDVAPGEVVIGSPALPFKDGMRLAAKLQRMAKNKN